MAILLLGVIVFADTSDWIEYHYTSYSFDPNYAIAEGEEIYCNFAYNYIAPSINCGDISIATDLLTRYRTPTVQDTGAKPVSAPETGGLDIQPAPESAPLSFEQFKNLRNQGLSIDQIIRFEAGEKPTLADDAIVNNRINNDDFENIRVKRIRTILYDTLMKNTVLIISIALAWFIFWESIIYRAIIYIIYGNTTRRKW